MRDEEKREFMEVITATMDVYGRDVSKGMLQMYWAALKDYSINEIKIGLTRCIKSTESGQFHPKPSDIIRMIEGAASDRGMLAWSKVFEAIKRVGHYRSVVFDDPIIHSVIEEMGGWVSLCMVNKEEMQFRAQEFAKRYRSYAETGGCSDYPAYLIGYAESQNNMNGFPSEQPFLVGNQETAKLVMDKGSTGHKIQISQMQSVGSLVASGLRPMIDVENNS